MRRLLHIVDEIPLRWFALAIFLTIVAFGFGYWALAEQGQLLYTYDSTRTPGLLDSIYFSVVTISSLGYGDIRPLGWARLLVAAEVLIGLSFLGFLVAKVSSVKQDYILKRLYSEAVDEKLAALVRHLEEQRALYRTTGALLMDGEIDPGLTTTFRRDTPGATFFSGYRQLLADLVDLVVFEASNHAFFGVVDDSRIESAYDSVRGVLRRTTLLWERDSERATELIFGGNGRELEQICALAEQIADIGRRRSRNADIVSICDAMLELAERIRREVLPAV